MKIDKKILQLIEQGSQKNDIFLAFDYMIKKNLLSNDVLSLIEYLSTSEVFVGNTSYEAMLLKDSIKIA